MTQDEIHRRITTLAEYYIAIAEGHPTDEKGFVMPANEDLRDALKVIQEAISILSRLAFRMNSE